MTRARDEVAELEERPPPGHSVPEPGRGHRKDGAGPYDSEDDDVDQVEGGLEFGALRVPMPARAQLQVEQGSSELLRAVHVLVPSGRVSLSALAAPRSAPLWRGLAREIAGSLGGDGARVWAEWGPWGREVMAGSKGALSRFVGVDGPRWMLYGVATGPADGAEELAETLREMVRGTVVTRGPDPLPVKTVLPLRLPEHLEERVERAREASARRPGSGRAAPVVPVGSEGPSGPSRSLDPETGPTPVVSPRRPPAEPRRGTAADIPAGQRPAAAALDGSVPNGSVPDGAAPPRGRVSRTIGISPITGPVIPTVTSTGAVAAVPGGGPVTGPDGPPTGPLYPAPPVRPPTGPRVGSPTGPLGGPPTGPLGGPPTGPLGGPPTGPLGGPPTGVPGRGGYAGPHHPGLPPVPALSAMDTGGIPRVSAAETTWTMARPVVSADQVAQQPAWALLSDAPSFWPQQRPARRSRVPRPPDRGAADDIRPAPSNGHPVAPPNGQRGMPGARLGTPGRPPVTGYPGPPGTGPGTPAGRPDGPPSGDATGGHPADPAPLAAADPLHDPLHDALTPDWRGAQGGSARAARRGRHRRPDDPDTAR
jgi:hypothetical protein